MSDLISREATKEMLIEEWTKHIPMELDINLSFVLDKIKELPSVTPQQKIGHWILSGGYWRCSECKEKALLKFDKSKDGCKEYMPIKSKYCPNCGAKMEVKE